MLACGIREGGCLSMTTTATAATTTTETTQAALAERTTPTFQFGGYTNKPAAMKTT